MYITSLSYNKEGQIEVTVCIYHPFIITRKDKKSCSIYILSLYYNKEGLRKVAACIYHHFITTRSDKEKVRYVYIITLLYQGRMKKSCSMYVLSFHYNKEE